MKPSTQLKKKKRIWESGAEHFLFNDFVQKKMINYGDISKKLISGIFTSSTSFSNGGNLKGKIPNLLFHCRTQCFF